MNTIPIILLCILALPLTTGMSPSSAVPLTPEQVSGVNEIEAARTITLTANQVSAANDIEAAIETATARGTCPGTVILDGSQGDFYYTGPDKSINLYYSNITLRGRHGATLANCDDGIFFDDLPADRILIEGITFVCRGSGITGWSGTYIHKQVIVRKNTIHAQGNGIEMGAMQNWNILRNFISAGNFAVHIIGGRGNQVARNQLFGFIGVFLHGEEGNSPSGNRVLMNQMQVTWQGVLIGYGVDGNKVRANRITGPQSSGIAFEGQNDRNVVTGNRVACAPGAGCLVVDAYPEAYTTNKIKGNTYFQPTLNYTPGEIVD